MRRVILTAICATSLITSAFLSSCSNDDGPIQGSEAKKFIGTWYSDAASGGTWTFNSDGTCEHEYNNSYDGTWSYSADSKILSTTIGNWNWEIYAVSSQSWTGRHLAGKGSTFTYERVD